MRLGLCLLGLAVTSATLGGLSCGDPVHDAAVAALGPEQNGVSPGPTHRPGQPCLTCHGGDGPASEVFVVAGTVYKEKQVAVAAVGASVHLVDATGLAAAPDPVTNEAGNFFVTPDQWNPTFPIGAPGATSPTSRDITVTPPHAGAGSAIPMTTQIARGGMYASCGYCHVDPPGPTSPGHIYEM